MSGEFNVFRKLITIKRQQGGAYINGDYVKGSDVDINILASQQPLTPNELQQLPEGRRTNQSFKFYTDIKLRTVNDENPENHENPDKAYIDNEPFEVTGVYPYQSGIINHYKVILTKVNKTDEL